MSACVGWMVRTEDEELLWTCRVEVPESHSCEDLQQVVILPDLESEGELKTGDETEN